MKAKVLTCGFCVLAALPAFGAGIPAPGRYALILQDAPAAKASHGGARRDAPEIVNARIAIRQKQSTLRSALQRQGIHVTGAVSTLLNAVFVTAMPKDLPALRSMPGVKYVATMRKIPAPMLNAAVLLIDGPNAWNIFGGIPNAGTGQKIAIIDTGIDQTHPAFQDSTLQTPSGYPICPVTADCAYTTNKIIVARSYVAQLAANNGPATSFPDDTSPVDRVGHGTAVAMCAGGNTNTAPLATITGLAPHAFLGNYKIFGSPEVNDGSSEDVIISALEDAFTDGMDIASLSSGAPAFSGPLDVGEICGNPAGEPCDPLVAAVETATQENMVVVVAAGNDGYDNPVLNYTLNSISSPADAPDAIAVGATGNSHVFLNTVSIAGSNVPSNLQTLPAVYGDGPVPASTLTAPLVDAAQLDNNGAGCNAFASGSLTGDIALVQRTSLNEAVNCDFVTKVQNAQTAGAVGVLIYDDVADELVYPGGLGGTTIPTFAITLTDGQNLKNYVDVTAGVTAALNPNLTSVPSSDTNQVTYFSSRGPGVGSPTIKPDVVAPGENIYMATQDFDPLGELYDPSRYTVQAGTSFSTPMVSGIAAMVRQQNPAFTVSQVRSAIINTATSDTTDPNYTGTATSTVISVGGGKVDALSAVTTNVVAVPATLSFGALASTFSSATQTFTVTNTSSGSLTLTLALNAALGGLTPTLSTSSVTLPAGQSQTVTMTLSGARPAAGVYQGSVLISGGAVNLTVPYLYMVSDGVPANVFALSGDDDGTPGVIGQQIADGYLAIRVTDQYGIPLVNVPVTWAALDGGEIDPTNFTNVTDTNGDAFAVAYLGDFEGEYTYSATVAGYAAGYTFTDVGIPAPVISTGGVVNAASFLAGNGIAPGSYVSVFGNSLTIPDFSGGANTAILPIAIGYTSVGFDATDVEVPAPLTYAGFTQVNIQAPWELAGQSSAQLKVDIEPVNGNLYTVPVVTYSPAMFVANAQVAALDFPNYNLITTANPAIPGQLIQIYCNGLGPVTNQPATGSPASSSPLSETTTPATVTIGGQNATVSFSGLAPGFPGLYQLNVIVPSGLGAGTQPVIVSIGGVSSPTVNIAVQ